MQPRPSPVVMCPAPLPVPAALPPVVSIERLAGAYHAVDVARQAERMRGDQCAETVRRFELWIREASRGH